jgi:hypothetical protein
MLRSNDFLLVGKPQAPLYALMLGAPSQKRFGRCPAARGRSPYRLGQWPRCRLPYGLMARVRRPCALAALSALPVGRAQAAVHLTQGKRLVPQLSRSAAREQLLCCSVLPSQPRSGVPMRKRCGNVTRAMRKRCASRTFLLDGVCPRIAGVQRRKPGARGNRARFSLQQVTIQLLEIRHFSFTFPHS